MKSNASLPALCATVLLLLPFLNPTISNTEAQSNDQRALGVSVCGCLAAQGEAVCFGHRR